MRSSVCKGCGAEIVRIQVLRQRRWESVPCDADPCYYIQKAGSKKIITPNGEVVACEYTDDPYKATGIGYVPHCCPAADSFRKGGKQ